MADSNQSPESIFSSTNVSHGALRGNSNQVKRVSHIGYDDSANISYSAVTNVMIHCPKCDLYVKVQSLRIHKEYHKALESLKWTGNIPPSTVVSLLRQRNSVLFDLKRELCKSTTVNNSLTSNECVETTKSVRRNRTSSNDANQQSASEILADIDKLNRAFEFLKNDIDSLANSSSLLLDNGCDGDNGGDAGCNKQFKEAGDIQSSVCDSYLSCVYAVGVCSCQNKKYKLEMEDSSVYKDRLLDSKNEKNGVTTSSLSYFAVFGGYHGSTASSKVSKYMHKFIRDVLLSLSRNDTTAQRDSVGVDGKLNNDGTIKRFFCRKTATVLQDSEEKEEKSGKYDKITFNPPV